MSDAVENLKTDVTLLRALERASHMPPSSRELLEQRVSFVYGSLDSNSAVTRERIRQILVEQGAVQAK